MPNVTLKAIEQLLDLKLDEKFDSKLAPIYKTLNEHTAALDSIAKDVKTLLDERTITAHRFERLEHWAQAVGPKVGVKLEL